MDRHIDILLLSIVYNNQYENDLIDEFKNLFYSNKDISIIENDIRINELFIIEDSKWKYFFQENIFLENSIENKNINKFNNIIWIIILIIIILVVFFYVLKYIIRQNIPNSYENKVK